MRRGGTFASTYSNKFKEWIGRVWYTMKNQISMGKWNEARVVAVVLVVLAAVALVVVVAVANIERYR